MTGNRIPLYLTDRQYTDLIASLNTAKQVARERDSNIAFRGADVARVEGLLREVFEQVITVRAG